MGKLSTHAHRVQIQFAKDEKDAENFSNREGGTGRDRLCAWEHQVQEGGSAEQSVKGKGRETAIGRSLVVTYHSQRCHVGDQPILWDETVGVEKKRYPKKENAYFN